VWHQCTTLCQHDPCRAVAGTLFAQPGGMILWAGLDMQGHFHPGVCTGGLGCKVPAIALVQIGPQTQHPLDFE